MTELVASRDFRNFPEPLIIADYRSVELELNFFHTDLAFSWYVSYCYSVLSTAQMQEIPRYDLIKCWQTAI